jgi:hypothetical protein
MTGIHSVAEAEVLSNFRYNAVFLKVLICLRVRAGNVDWKEIWRMNRYMKIYISISRCGTNMTRSSTDPFYITDPINLDENPILNYVTRWMLRSSKIQPPSVKSGDVVEHVPSF